MVDVSEVKLKKFPYTMTYSQQKTGSTTVMKAVGSVNVPCHRCYAGNVKQYHKTDMPTITMVRDPVERAISELWELLLSDKTFDYKSTDFLDEWKGKPAFSSKKIIESLGWFGLYYRPITGINVYGDRFNRKSGWSIYSIRGLLLRTDKLSEALEPALNEFLPPYFPDADMSKLVVEHRAKGEDRFGNEYAEFLETVKFPRKFLEEIYDSEYCRHFFYVKELKAFIKRWKE